MICFSLETEPIPKGRPRFTRSGHAYTPQKTRAFEEQLRFEFLASTCEKLPVYTKDTPILVEALFVKSIPKSWSKKKREAALRGEILPTSRPDIDNYLKTLDALIGLAYEDDSQIVQIIAEKMYAEKPSVTVRIMALGEEVERP